MAMKSIADRIKHARKTLGLSQEEFGVSAGVSKSAVSQWEGEITKPERDSLSALLRRFDLNPEWIMHGTEPMFVSNAYAGTTRVGEPLVAYGTVRINVQPIDNWEKPDDLPSNEYAFVPRNFVSISATDGRLIYRRRNEPPLVFATNWIKTNALHRRNLVLMEAIGESMTPRICNGDLLLVDQGKNTIQDGETYAIRYRTELRVRRLFQNLNSTVILRASNFVSFPDETVSKSAFTDDLEIIGRVIWLSGDF